MPQSVLDAINLVATSHSSHFIFNSTFNRSVTGPRRVSRTCVPTDTITRPSSGPSSPVLVLKAVQRVTTTPRFISN